MNREIKFRAWDKKKSIIREVGEIKFDGKFYNVRIIEPTDYAPRNWSLRYFDEVILMQFTGLHDKNGKEIYEGDCFTDGSLAGDFGGMKRFIGVIGFENGCFVVIKSNCDCGECLKDCISRYGEQDIEVIGNIYENPELLTKK